MAMSKIPIIRPVTTGYRDAWAALRMMPALGGCALLIIVAVNLVEFVVPTDVVEDSVLGNLLSFAVSAVQNFFIAPVMIAVHRFIILGEVTARYSSDPNQPGFRAFFAWLMALSIVGLIVAIVVTNNGMPAVISGAVTFAVLIGMIFVTTQLSILLPAIAVQSPGASAANAWADSKGHVFNMFLIFLLASLPLLIAAVLFILPLSLAGDDPVVVLAVLRIIVLSMAQMFLLILSVAIASRLYQALADRLLRGP